ncbi:ATP-dependent endonuclease [Pseudomonas sp. NFACC08-1]|uniref:ATP-dependent nuclease n=1 Tax=Pseudomonas sp. NFACC08-1 TaxID=1566238 RepID=UPI0008977765|nr:ATP-binding protein [Pseudomonas sp. NFACC08-1]SDW04946.1 AAA domain-containing protein, putative AbiEii toxin, Type IV TA system [Pseudomonas sp. NFACC08-1]
MYKYSIEEVCFSDGTSITPGSLTVIVGPNNSGKSRALRDIENLVTGGTRSQVVVTGLKHSTPHNVQEFRDAYNIQTHTDVHSNVFFRSLSSTLTTQHNIHVGPDWEKNLEYALSTRTEDGEKMFASWFGNMFVSMFSTEDRLKLVKESDSAERGYTENLLQAFYTEGIAAEERVRTIVREAFKKDIRLDFSSLRKILLRIGDDLSSAPVDAREALGYYEHVDKLDDQGDGIRSFVATILTLLVGKRPVLLLDEPEAFLHPPQAFRLGEVIAKQADADRQVIVATHSSELLRGILSQRRDVSIIRVNRVGDRSEIKILSSEGVASFSSDPLLSSTRILDGLFYKGAIIVEADADSVFYQRIGRRLVDADSFHVAHAHNKQTVAKVLSPYRSLGVQYAAIVDFDVIRVRAEFNALIKQFNFDTIQKNKLEELRALIVNHIERVPSGELLTSVIGLLKNEIDAIESDSRDDDLKLSSLLGTLKRVRESGSAWKPYKKSGRAALEEKIQLVFDELCQICASRGLFIVPVGELEGWLTDYGLAHTSNKSKWIVDALELMPELEPDLKGGPWSFLSSVHSYLGR